MNTFQKIIKEICDENKINFDILSKDWVITLEKDSKVRYIAGYKFDLNNHGLGVILDDKYAMYDVLNKFNLPIIKHYIVYRNNNLNEYAIGCNSYDYVLSLFHKFNNSIVLKPNNGACGVGVYHILDEDTLLEVYNNLLAKNFSISACPFYDIENEYRAIIINDEIKLLYGKIRPVVIGDGKSTIYELLTNFNYEYFKDYVGDNKDKVLNINEIYEHDWKFNLSRGSKMFRNIVKSDYEKISSLALKTAKAVGLGFGSVDIIKTKTGDMYIMEINSGVMMDNFIKQDENGYEIAKSIYSIAIEEMFKEV